MIYVIYKLTCCIRKNIFACLFSIYNTISLSRHEQVCLSGLMLVHDVIILLYYKRFYFIVKPGWISAISCNHLMRNIVWEHVFNSFIKKRDFFINRKVFKCPFPRKICDCFFYNIRVCIFLMPDFPFIWWRIVNLEFKFCMNYLMMTIWM